VLLVSVAEKVGTDPVTGLLLESLRVIVIVDVAEPSATTGPVPVMLEFAATAASAVKVTVPPIFETGVRISSVLISALVAFKEQVEIPLVFVVVHAP
jgi:hypothetical protein